MLFTKLHKPVPGNNLIRRTHLLQKLNDGIKCKLILVSAPAGYGKTSLLSQWININKLSAAWYSLDKRDNDVKDFLKFMITGLRKIDQKIGANSLNLLESGDGVESEYIVELLLNDILESGDDIWLILDDYQLIQSKEVLTITSFILEHCPPNFHLVISTRSDPPLSTARLRGQNQLLEIRASDLSFSEQDISILFNKVLHIELNKDEVNILARKTEGWIAGLQLTSITLKEQENTSAYLQKLAGDNRYIMDYLIEEVLNIQTEEMREFLLKTSILEKLSGPLCDFILEKKGSQQLLEELEKRNMFIVPLDHTRKWFRYHHLFADLLKQRFTINDEDISNYHQRASEWFEKSNEPLMAIEHALQANDQERAIAILNNIVESLWMKASYITIFRLGNMFTREVLLNNLNFYIVYLWTLTIFGKLEESEKQLEIIEKRALETNTDSKILGRLYCTFNLLKVFNGDVDDAFIYSKKAVEYLDDIDILWKVWAYVSHGESHLLRFELDKCMESLKNAWELSKKTDSIYLRMVSASKATYVMTLQGRYSEAYQICTELLDEIQKGTEYEGISEKVLTSILYSVIGCIQVNRNQVDEGLPNVQRAYDYSRRASSISFKGYCALLLADAYYKTGHIAEAVKIMDEFDEILVLKVAQWLYVLGESLKSKLHGQSEVDYKTNTVIKPEDVSTNEFGLVFLNIAKARNAVNEENGELAISLVEKVIQKLVRQKANELLIESYLILCKAHLLNNDPEKARQYVVSALFLAQEEDIIQLFINEGEAIEQILTQIKKEQNTTVNQDLEAISSNFLEKLLITFSIDQKAAGSTKEELLSSREIDIVNCIADGKANQEIADHLFISLNTVKTHLKNIYIKLEVDSRTKAVEKAKSLGIIT